MFLFTMRQFTPEHFKRMVAMYNAGNSVRTIADAFDCPYSTMHRYLKAYGVKFRPKGGANGNQYQKKGKK